MNKEFWNKKKVLLTGHTGFKGSWLSIWLQSMGAEVTGYALEPHTQPNLFSLGGVNEDMNSIYGDVRDLDLLCKVFEQHKPEVVIHMAAQAIVSESFRDPVKTYTTNIVGTLNVLEAVRTVGDCRVALFITSDKCYENNGWVWGYRENDMLGGRDPYSSSKASAELIIRSYRESFFPDSEYHKHGLAIASTRAGNVIGGGDWSNDRLIPDIIKAIMSQQVAIIRNPNALRPWQFVLEPLSGYLSLVEHLWDDGSKYTGSWNFGPNIEEIYPVSWIADYITNEWGEDAQWIQSTSDNDSIAPSLKEEHFLKLDITKSKSLLNWSPRLTLSTSLNLIVKWYKAMDNNEPIRALVEQQIAQYEDAQ